jgi:hypothetical protein
MRQAVEGTGANCGHPQQRINAGFMPCSAAMRI